VPKIQLTGVDKELRMVIDYSALDSVIVNDCFPLALLEELIDCLQGKLFFSKMDIHFGYYQDQVATSNIEKLLFIGPNDLWE
jgi:hypothetical protein